MTSSCTSSSSLNFQECGENPMFHLRSLWSSETHLPPVRSAWETSAQNPSVLFIWRNTPRIWWDFGSAPPFQTRLTQTMPVLPTSNEHGSQVKDQGRWQCCHSKHKKFPYRPTLSRHASYKNIPFKNVWVCNWFMWLPGGLLQTRNWTFRCHTMNFLPAMQISSQGLFHQVSYIIA